MEGKNEKKGRGVARRRESVALRDESCLDVEGEKREAKKGRETLTVTSIR